MSDYINREVAIAYIRELAEESRKVFEDLGGESGIYADAYNELAEDFRKIHAADVEPVRRGEWRLVRRMAAFGEYKCSVCGRIETFGYFNKQENNPYCHCGAKMCLEDETNDD